MKRNKTARRWLRKRKRAVKGGLAKLIELTGDHQITSPKRDTEHAKSAAPTQPLGNDSGIIRQDAAALRLPNALAEAGETEPRDWMPTGFIFFVVGLAILFIAIIAWQVSEMPSAK